MAIELKIESSPSYVTASLEFPNSWEAEDKTLVSHHPQGAGILSMISRAAKASCPNKETCEVGASISRVDGVINAAFAACPKESCEIGPQE